jgi:DNA-binding CsgD family transcriptional regulator/GAF domain-containing protein
MSGGVQRLEALREDIAALGRRGLARERLFAEVGARLRRAVPADAMCWHTVDPETRLMTSDAPAELISSGVFSAEEAMAAGARIVASEYLLDDVNTFAGLARRRVPAATLAQATGGRLERSTRYRELLAPAGIPHELRAAFVTRGRCWGAVHIARREDRRDFSADETALLAGVAAAIAEGIRTSLAADAGREATGAGAPGLVVLGPRDEVELITPPARELLALMRSAASSARDETPPGAVLSLAAFLRSGRAQAAGAAATVAVPTPGGWITLHGSLPDGGRGDRVAVVLERAASPQTTAVRLETHGVTAREREIAALLARGLTNAEIATRLVLSPYTVQDHIKSLFEKTGVANRQELVARMFLDDYLPHVEAGAPIGPSGGFSAA